MQSVAWDILRQLAERGHEVTVLTTRLPRARAPFNADGVSVVPLSETTPEKQNGKWWQATRRYIRDHYAATPPDVVFSVSSAGAGALAWKERWTQTAFVFQAHGTSWTDFVSKMRSGDPRQYARSLRSLYWIFRDATIYPRFDKVIAVGDVLGEIFSRPPVSWLRAGVPVEVIRNGIDMELFKPDSVARSEVRAALGWSADSPVLVFAARLHEQKGAHIAVDVFRKVHELRPEVRLLLIGGGAQESHLRSKIVAEGLASVVAMTGTLPRDAVARHLAAGDVFLFPSLCQEGLPLNVLEALSVGLKPVCSASMSTVFQRDLPIVYADPANIPQWVKACQHLLTFEAGRPSLLPADYSLQSCVDRYLTAFTLRAAIPSVA
ncbi:MAG: glycosyltransferase family 4 protein [Pseudomonadota bacterium]